MVCSICGCEKILAKGLCNKCYQKKRLQDNPDLYVKKKKYIAEYQKTHPEKVKQWKENYKNKDIERYNKLRRLYIQKYYERNPEKKIESFERMHERNVCKILKKHTDDLKDDPERLSTEFIQNLIGIKRKSKN